MLARENGEQAQEKMLKQFEQSREHLDEAGITSIQVGTTTLVEGRAWHEYKSEINVGNSSFIRHQFLRLLFGKIAQVLRLRCKKRNLYAV